jgi:hypothetical protein
MIRGIGPEAKVINKSVLLRVLVDVRDQMDKVGVRIHEDAPEWVLKEAACAPIGLVDCFGVGVEQVSELLAGILGLGDP